MAYFASHIHAQIFIVILFLLFSVVFRHTKNAIMASDSHIKNFIQKFAIKMKLFHTCFITQCKTIAVPFKIHGETREGKNTQ